MKSIFLCFLPDTLDEVYTDEVKNFLKDEVELDTSKIYDKDDVLAQPLLYKDVEFIFSTWGMPCFSEEEIKHFFPSLKCIFYAGGSVQEFARPFLNCGVRIFGAWVANGVPVAEFTVAQIILANKSFFHTSRMYKNREYSEAKNLSYTFPGNYGEYVGIIGAGTIGKLVIKMLRHYNLRVLVFDPFMNEETASQLGVTLCSLEDIFRKCFVISNHLADNEQTRGILNYSMFSLMRENSTLINTGRGAQIVEEDLARILRERTDISAILDVTTDEPLDLKHPFFDLENCIISPHIAGSIGSEVQRLAEYMANEYVNYREQKICEYEITADMLKTMA